MLVHSQDVVIISDDDSDEKDSLQVPKSPPSKPRGYASNQDIDLWNQISQYNEAEIQSSQDNTRKPMKRPSVITSPGSSPVSSSRQSKRLRKADNEEHSHGHDHNPTVDTPGDVVEVLTDDEESSEGKNASEGGDMSMRSKSSFSSPAVAAESTLGVQQANSHANGKPTQTVADSSAANNEDESSDEEIAVLSKEEAERSGKFKPTSFENRRPHPLTAPTTFQQQNRAPFRVAPPSIPGYNQPVPSLHYNSAMSSHEMQEVQQDQKARKHFHEQSEAQLKAYDSRLTGQVGRFELLRDSYLDLVRGARGELQLLPLQDSERKSELIREVHLRLQDAESAISRIKKIRRYQSVLHTVLEEKSMGIQYQPPNIYPTLNPIQQSTPLPGSYHSTSYYPQVYQPPIRQGFSSDNPYEDTVQLQNLLKDVGEEEEVEGMENTPSELSVQLLDHQRQGLHWLLKREKSNQGCILADDMGLGKTVQAIALLMASKSEDKKCKTTLIVGPVSLLRQWGAEFRAKVQMESRPRVAFFHGLEKKALSSFAKMKRYDVILTSYTTLASEFKNHFAEILEEAQVSRGQNVLPDLGSGGRSYVSPFYSLGTEFYRVILDEAQLIKGKVTLSSKATACLKARHRLCLTGTPLQNSIDELYPLLRFLKTKPYDNEEKFKSDISVPIKSTNGAYDDYDRNRSMQKLRAILAAIMLRRTKDSKIDGKPLLQLPKKSVDLIYVSMGKEEEEFYKELEKGVQKKARKLMQMKSQGNSSNILTLLLRLRQACIHQYLVEVGDMNTEERLMGETRYLDWKTMYSCCQNLNSSVRERISNDLRKNSSDDFQVIDVDEGPEQAQLTCPICFDVVDESSIIILHPCGHMVCDGCIDDLFQEDASGNYIANCPSCKQEVTPDDLIEFSVYAEVVLEGASYQTLEGKYGSISRHTTSTAQKIKKLTDKYGGFLTSAKMAKTLSLVKDVTETTVDDKIIIFSHFTGTFDLLGMVFKEKKIKFLRYDGSMNIDRKNDVIKEFYSGDTRVLLLSLKAGNVGLTLTCASHVIIMDPFWNPFVEEQAMDRAHRLGQKKPVRVYKFLIQDSVEDRIMDLQKRKKELVDSALDPSALKKSSSLGRAELGFLFGLNSMNAAV